MPADPKRVETVFNAARAIPAPDRPAFLAAECADDAELRARVERLLAAHEELGDPATAALPTDPPTATFGDHTGTADHTPRGDVEGTVLAGRYKLVEEVGEGGMGTVWMARQTEPVRRMVAVKLIKAGMDSRAVLARFEAERQALALMDHPNIAKVLDAGATADGRPFFVMELVKGVPITKYCDERKLTPKERLELFVPVCNAIQHAHQKGVIHRDIKPTNVLVALYDDSPVPKVIDFGVAKAAGQQLTERTLATGFGAVVGTPEYMSPEQASFNNLDIDTRADVYALGVLLYELLAGSPPFSRKELEKIGLMEIFRVIREQEPPKPSTKFSTADALPTLSANRGTEPAKLTRLLRGELDWIVMKALEKDRTRRYETANGFAMDVQRYLAGEPVLAHPPSPGYRLKKLLRRNRAAVLMATAVAVALLAGTAVATWQAVVATRARADLAAKNTELTEEQAKVQARFELAQKAIATFHTGVSEDVLLKNEQFKELRTRLLTEAAKFYADLEKLLAGQTDARSRKALAAAYFQLAELTDKIWSKPEALAVHRKALALRRELAAAEGADVETRLDVARSLRAVGGLLTETDDLAGARAAAEEQRDLAARLEAEAPTDTVRFVLAQSHHRIGWLLSQTGKPEEALEVYGKALAIRQKLAADNPAVTQFQLDLAMNHNNVANMLLATGKPTDALEALRRALAIREKLAADNPTVPDFQDDLAQSHGNIGQLLSQTGNPAEAMGAYRDALAIFQKLADANPAVNDFQDSLAKCHQLIGELLLDTGKPAKAMESLRDALGIRQKLATLNPTINPIQRDLSQSHYLIGWVLSQTGKSEEALEEYGKALGIRQKLADANPTVTQYQQDLANTHNNVGWLLAQMGKPEEAMEAYRDALAIFQKLADAHRDVPRFQSELVMVHINVGRLLASQKRFPEAFATLDESLARSQKLAKADPKTLLHAQNLVWSHAFRGWTRVRVGQPAEAAADLRRAVELWAELPQLDTEAKFERSRVLALLAGLGGDAKSGVTAAEAKAFADQAVAALRDAIKAGWAQAPADLKEPDFDALRGRADFQKLVAEVDAKVEKVPERAPPPRGGSGDRRGPGR